MHRLFSLLLGGCLVSGMAMAQFGGRVGDVVIYAVTSKGPSTFNVVAANRVNSAAGFQIIDPTVQTPVQFGPNFPGESYVTLHSEPNDNFRFIIQQENILTQHNTWQAAAKLFIAQGIDVLLFPNGAAQDLTAGLFAPFPATVDFGPELPEIQAHSFMWTASPIFPLLQPAPPGYTSPIDPPGYDGSQYVLSLGTFDTLVPWIGLNDTYPGQGWEQGIDVRTIETDATAGTTVMMIRLRPGRQTPPFLINANTHLAVLSGSVNLVPTTGAAPATLTQFQYAFIPNGFAMVLSNPAPYTGPTTDYNPFYPYPNPFNPLP
jgi:hypothetical protein